MSISSGTSGATIHYTTDGSTPTASSTTYTDPFILTSSQTVKAIAVKSGMANSFVASKSVSVSQVATPVISTTTVSGGQQVSISSGTSGATIHYTTDGSTPTASSTTYTDPFILTSSQTVKAIAVKSGMTDSSVATESVSVSQVATPVISTTAVSGGQQVSISSGTSGATIHYTTDGTTPTTSSPVYSSSFKLTSTKTVKAFAVKTGMLDSSVASQSITVSTVTTPTISATAVAGGQQVSISSGTGGATIHYTTDGSIPTASSSIYTAPFILTSSQTVKAFAMKAGMLDSSVASQSITVSTVTAPIINVTAVAGGQQVSISSGTSGATIHYTTDGSTPTASSSIYTAPFILTSSQTIKAFAVKAGMTDSSVVTESVSVSQVATPVISPTAVSGGQQVSISSGTSGATIHYTTDGSTPTASSTIYTAPFILTSSQTVKAIAVNSGMANSFVASKSVSVSQVATPVISTTAVSGGQQVSISSGTSGATIYYTTDGTTPTTSSPMYSSSFKLTSTKTVKAFAVKTGMLDSSVASQSITVSTVTAPTINVTAVAGGQQVSISSGTSGATIHYTTDGTTPTTSSPMYSSSFKLISSKTVKAFAVKTGMLDSSVASQSITVSTVTAPTINVTAVAGGQQVSISSGTSGATIHYTTDGSTPTASSTTYTNPFILTSSQTVKAFAVKAGMTDSSVATESVTVSRVETPTISPSSTSFSGSQTVTISCATSSATIYYTTDGTTPTTSSTTYTDPFTLTSSQTVKAIAVKSGMTNSSVSSQTYTLMSSVAAPIFSPEPIASGFDDGQTVTISSSTADATIYYTIAKDDVIPSDPTTADTIYTGPLTVGETSTIKAIAIKSGMQDSAVVTKTYVINGSIIIQI